MCMCNFDKNSIKKSRSEKKKKSKNEYNSVHKGERSVKEEDSGFR